MVPIESILGQKQIAKRWDGLAQLAMALHIQMPQTAVKLAQSEKKIQKKISSQVNTFPSQMPVENLTLERGFIPNADDTDCQQIPQIAPNSSGAVLMYYEETRQWLEKAAVLSRMNLHWYNCWGMPTLRQKQM